MTQQLHLRDQVHGRPAADALVLQWQDGVPLTPRTLIAERVRLEWDAREAEHEAKARAHAARLPFMDMMRQANPYRRADAAHAGAPAAANSLTLDAVTALALDAFRRNAFFLVVDGRQARDLDEVIPLRPTSTVTFVRLLPLKGG